MPRKIKRRKKYPSIEEIYPGYFRLHTDKEAYIDIVPQKNNSRQIVFRLVGKALSDAFYIRPHASNVFIVNIVGG